MSDNRGATPAGAANFSATELRRRMAEREAAKAAEEQRHIKEQEEKQKQVMAEFHKPPDRTPEQVMQSVMQLVNRAAERGQSEVQVYRFPNTLCSDRGRRINNSEPDWETTLEGRPKAAYEFWHEHLRPLGFHLRAEVLEYPSGMPGDIGFILTW
jgi:exonuclease VII large subunit